MDLKKLHKGNDEVDLILKKIKAFNDFGFPIEKIHGQYNGVLYELMIIYKNGFWFSIYSLCEIFRRSENELINIIEGVYEKHLNDEKPIKIEFITFYPVDVVWKLSEQLQSELGVKICKDFIDYAVNQDVLEVNCFLWSIYEKKDNIFSEIVLTAYNVLATEMEKYNTNVSCRNYHYADKIYHAKYGISQLDSLRICVYGFVSYMYMKNQNTNNLYKQTKEYLQSDNSACITDNMSPLKNTYKKLKKEYDSLSDIFQTKDDFDHMNIHATDREKPVSYKISENGKKVSVDKVLLRHEYELQRYKNNEKYRDFFLMARKISNGTIGDNKHYSQGQICDAIISLTQLCNDVISDADVPVIDKCMVLDDLESKYKIEMFYQWLKTLKCHSCLSKDNLEHIAMLYAMWIDTDYEKSYFPYENFKNITHQNEHGEQEIRCALSNAMYYGYDKACEYYSCNMDEFDLYLDFIIAFNVIRQHVLEVLENKYAVQMKNFDYYNNILLNEFLNDFIGQGQHINFDKHPYEDIDIEDLRYIYQQIIPKNK